LRVRDWIRRARRLGEAAREEGEWRIAYILKGIAGYLEGAVKYGLIDPEGEIGEELRKLVV